ncbi:MAG: ATP-binding cassette domain-containing protein [Ilumatobacteraceae bacterium]
MSMEVDLLLEARNLRRVYKLPRTSILGGRAERHALRGVDLALPAGGSLGIVGESGSGKTTLVRILLGLDRATSGSVLYRGRPIVPGRPHSLRWFRREVQIVFQDPLSSLDPRQTVESIIREPLTCLQIEGDHHARVLEVLDAVGLEADMRRRYPYEFSGGQQQRIAIARAIAAGPAVLVGDEPVSALDVSVRIQILDLLRRLATDMGLALVLVSHDLGVVRHLCDDVLVLHEGVAVERGPVGEVFTRPQHDYTRQLLAAVPRIRTSGPARTTRGG